MAPGSTRYARSLGFVGATFREGVAKWTGLDFGKAEDGPITVGGAPLTIVAIIVGATLATSINDARKKPKNTLSAGIVGGAIGAFAAAALRIGTNVGI